jgi:hypothetical protein
VGFDGALRGMPIAGTHGGGPFVWFRKLPRFGIDPQVVLESKPGEVLQSRLSKISRAREDRIRLDSTLLTPIPISRLVARIQDLYRNDIAEYIDQFFDQVRASVVGPTHQIADPPTGDRAVRGSEPASGSPGGKICVWLDGRLLEAGFVQSCSHYDPRATYPCGAAGIVRTDTSCRRQHHRGPSARQRVNAVCEIFQVFSVPGPGPSCTRRGISKSVEIGPLLSRCTVAKSTIKGKSYHASSGLTTR